MPRTTFQRRLAAGFLAVMLALLSCRMTSEAKALEQAGAPGVLTTNDIEILGFLARSFVPRDEFDSLSLPSIEGKTFEITLVPYSPTSRPPSCTGSPSWSYDPADQTLAVSLGGEDFSLSSIYLRGGTVKKTPGDIWGDHVDIFALMCTRINFPSYRAANAYGATVTVEKRTELVTAVVDLPDKTRSQRPEYNVQMSPDEARKLTPYLRVRYRGRVSDWGNRRPIGCGKKHSLPTLDMPVDYTFDLCVISGRVDLIEVIDIRDNRVLFSNIRHQPPPKPN